MSLGNLPPDFVLIGAAKCGTTALYDMLCNHPGIFGSPVKEPHYFSQFKVDQFTNRFRKNNVIDPDSYFANDELSEQFQLFITDLNLYLRLFATASDQMLRGEASTSYLYSDRAARAISEHNPDTKIIAILRNPIDRVFSHYTMALKYGYTTDDFLTAVRKDQNVIDKGWGRSQLYLELGHYDEQIARYFQYFPREHIHLIHYDDWRSNPQREMQALIEFLNLDPIEIPSNNFRNVGEIPRFVRVNQWFHQLGIRQSLADHIPLSLKKTIRSWYLKPKDKLHMEESARAYLLSYYRPRIERLAEIWGRDLSSWMD